MKKVIIFVMIFSAIMLLGGCVSNDYSEELVGKWEVGGWESDDHFRYFFEDGTCYIVFFEEEDYKITGYTDYVVGTYSNDWEFITTSFNSNDIEFSYTMLPLDSNGFSSRMLELCRHVNDVKYEYTYYYCDVNEEQDNLVGTWQIVGTEGDFDSFKYDVSVNEYIRTFSFYNDNTYKADWWFYHRGEEHVGDEVTYGNYQIVNDGRVICFDGQSYYDFELIGYGLLKLVDPSGNILLYILQ